MYSVNFSSHALDNISKLDKTISGRILNKIEWLSTHFDAIIPQPLKGKFHGIYKLIVGDWRVLYTFSTTDRTITIHLVGHRKDIYKS